MPVNQANYVYRKGTAPNTRAAVSQKNRVYGYSVGNKNFQQLGAVSEFGFDESRTVDAYRGVGYGDQIAELVPGVTEPMALTINKTLLYAANLFQLFGYKGGIDGLVRSLRHHRWPFDIKQELVFSDLVSGDAADKEGTQPTTPTTRSVSNTNTTAQVKALVTFFEGCWMNSYNASFASDSALVTENSSVTVSDVYDGKSKYGEYINSGLDPSLDGTAGAGTSLRFNPVGTTPTAN